MFFRRLIRICLFAAIPSVIFVMGARGQERTSGEVLTLDRAIEVARANNRDTKRARFDLTGSERRRHKPKTSYYPRFDTYLLGTQLLAPLNFSWGGPIGNISFDGADSGYRHQPAHSCAPSRHSVDYGHAADHSDSKNPLFCC